MNFALDIKNLKCTKTLSRHTETTKVDFQRSALFIVTFQNSHSLNDIFLPPPKPTKEETRKRKCEN